MDLSLEATGESPIQILKKGRKNPGMVARMELGTRKGPEKL